MAKHDMAGDTTLAPRSVAAPLFYKMSLSDKLAHSLAEKISQRVFKRGARLPTEADLCTIHGVSRITVRRALDALQRDGMIERIAGRGTFVTGSNRIASWRLDSIEDLVRFIADTRTEAPKVLKWGVVTPIAEARRFLKIPRGKTYGMLSVRYLGRRPIHIVEAYLPLAIGDLIKLEDLKRSTPVELYETRLDMPLQRVVEEISATSATEICAAPLGISVGDPVVLHTLEIYGPDGPLQYVREWWHPKYFRRRLELTRN